MGFEFGSPDDEDNYHTFHIVVGIAKQKENSTELELLYKLAQESI